MKKYILPATLSATICPGLGQMVKGEGLKGVAILIGLPLGLFVTVVITVLSSIVIGIVLSACLIGLYVWSVYDAYTYVPPSSDP